MKVSNECVEVSVVCSRASQVLFAWGDLPTHQSACFVGDFFFHYHYFLETFLGDGTEIRFSSWIVGTKNESPVEYHFSFPDFLLFCVT